MNLIKIFIVCIIVSLVSACGTGKFFIKRAINSLQDDVSDEFKDYADFNQDQEEQIDAIAEQVDAWVRAERLPVLIGELEKMAQDIEESSQISNETWASTISLLERPMNLVQQDNVVENIANVVHSMSDDQADQTIIKLQNDYRKTRKERQKVTLEKQNKKLAKGFKVVFSELGISRSKAQITQVKAMLTQRQSHIDLDNQASDRDQNTFLELVRNRKTEQADYVTRFTQAWETAEHGAKHQAPELWAHNAKIAFEVLNYLLSDLDQMQRKTAAEKIRGYAGLFRTLSVIEE